MTRYGVIMPDPPWEYREPDALRSFTGTGMVTAQYQTMTVEQMAGLRPQLDAWVMGGDCAVPMWVTAPKIPESLQLAQVWGLEFVTVLLVWLKTKPGRGDDQLMLPGEFEPRNLGALFHCGMGFYSRSATEFVFLFRRGKPPMPDDRSIGQVIAEPIREHSRKPDEAYHRVARMWPDVPRLEMFARTKRPGWDAWGNEVDKFKTLETEDP